MNISNLKFRLKKYEDKLKVKIASVNPKRKYPTKMIQGINNKIVKLTQKIISTQEKQIIKTTQKMAVEKMKSKLQTIKTIAKPIDRSTKRIDRAYEKLIKEAEKINIQYKNKNDWYKPKVVITKQYNYFLRIKFYKQGMSEDENDEQNEHRLNEIENPDEEQGDFFKNKDVEFDEEGNVYYNIWKYPLTIKLNRNPTDLKINDFYNDVDDGAQFIKNCVEIFIDDKTFKDNYYEHFKSYINGFKIASITKVEMIDDVNIENIDQVKYKLDDDNIGIHNKFTQYNINENGNTLKEMLTLNFNNEYLKNNYRKNCCFLTAIINKFYNRFNTRDSKGFRRHKELTYDYLCSLFHLENKPSDIECSIQQAMPFFTKNKLGLTVYDTCMNIVYTYESTLDVNKASTLRLISRDNHLYELNKDEIVISHKHDISEVSDLQVSSNYRIAKDEDSVEEIYLIKEFSEVEKYIKSNAKITKDKNVKFITNEIYNMLMTLKTNGLIPKVYCHKFDFYKLLFVIGKITISIEKADITTETEPDLEFKDIEQYKHYHEINNTFYKSIVKEEYKSYYHESVTTIHDKYKIMANCGKFDSPNINKEYPALDERKAYTECLMSIKQIGIYDYFDVYNKYNNEVINDLSYYIIEVQNISNELTILFKEKVSRTLGFILKSIPSTEYKILYYRTPYKTLEVDFKTPVDNLYKTDLSENFKKK